MFTIIMEKMMPKNPKKDMQDVNKPLLPKNLFNMAIMPNIHHVRMATTIFGSKTEVFALTFESHKAPKVREIVIKESPIVAAL